MCHTTDEPCGGTFLHEDIKKCLSDIVYANYEETVIIKEIYLFANIFDNYYICPFCNKYGVCCDIDINDMRYLDCKRCNSTWCRECKKKSHGLTSCYKIIDGNETEEAINKIIAETITEAVSHKCPKCFTKYIKLEGCNLITCSTCHSYSCYLCGILIKDKNDKYSHFYDKFKPQNNVRTCVLFNDYGEIERDQGNKKYNEKAVLLACEKLLNENNNKELQKKLLKSMMKNDVDIKRLNNVNKNIVKTVMNNDTDNKWCSIM